jgi:hypothetical protein
MAIDIHSLTWKSVLKFVEQERQDAIQMLIADRDSERQRGALVILERLETLASLEDTTDQ